MRAVRERISERAPEGDVDYVEVVDPLSLAGVRNTEGSVLIALAVRFGSARLIDNRLVD